MYAYMEKFAEKLSNRPRPSSVLDLTDQIRELLASGPVPRRIGSGMPGFDTLAWLITRHPRVEEKVGVGVTAFLVHRGFSGHLALDLLRTDGTRVDISWRKCATGADLTPALLLRRAMRQVVRDQIAEALAAWMVERPPCPLCGLEIHSDAHVDHVTPFETLVRTFCADRSDVPTAFGEDPETHRTTFADPGSLFVRAWRVFHGSHAELRLTHAKCNLSRPRVPA